jgi:hypothetical protein
MPVYQFRNTETGAITEEILSISSMEKHLMDHPELEIYHSTAPAIGDTVRMGLKKPDAAFRDLLGHIKKGQGRGSTINNF